MRRLAGWLLVLSLVLAPLQVRGETGTQSLRDVVERVSPSVVAIAVVKREPPTEPGEPARIIAATGSGFVIRQGGYILSNAHVLDHALAVRITTSDGKTYNVDPSQIWADAVSDLAVARVEADLPPAPWADTKTLRAGDPVFAVGAPFGLRFRGSISRGILSGFERPLGADYPFLQHDAPINPGNSGGPLFNAAGEVVGVNTRGILGGDGMGFAVPADVARDIADMLIADGKVTRAWLGLRFESDQSAHLGWFEPEGLMVSLVEPDGPAAQAGIQAGDILVRVNRTNVRTFEQMGAYLRSVAPGTPVTITYLRGSQEKQATIIPVTRPHDAELYYSADGLWVNMTRSQAEQALRFGREWAHQDEAVLTDNWTTYISGARALLVTEYLAMARLGRESARLDSTPTEEQVSDVLQRHKGLVEVQVDLPIKLKIDAPQKLWAEWRDQAGSFRALSVRVADSAPAGFQRLVITMRSELMEKRGAAVLVLHLSDTIDRRFPFSLDQIH